MPYFSFAPLGLHLKWKYCHSESVVWTRNLMNSHFKFLVPMSGIRNGTRLDFSSQRAGLEMECSDDAVFLTCPLRAAFEMEILSFRVRRMDEESDEQSF